MTSYALLRPLAAIALTSTVLLGARAFAEEVAPATSAGTPTETTSPAPAHSTTTTEEGSAPTQSAPKSSERSCKIGPSLHLPPLAAAKTKAKTAFALGLLTAVAKDGKSNVAVSPFGVEAILATLDLGADAKMKASIAHTLALSSSKGEVTIEDLRREVRLLSRTGEAADGPFASAALLLIDHRVKPTPGIADAVAAETGIELRPVDFAEKETLAAIDRWTSDRTHGRITSIMEPGDRPEFAAIDAFAFKDCWRYAFDPADTAPKPFTRLDGSRVDRSTMHRRGTQLAYGTTGRFVSIELPYADDRFALTLVTSHDPSTALSSYAAPEVQDFIVGRRMKDTEVDLALPKFIGRDSHELTDTLRELGLLSAGSLAGFAPGLKLSEIRQKTFVAADEMGTEAAAVTAGFATRGLPSPDKATKVTFDHPFLYALRHRQTGSIVMIGWVADPEAAQ